MKDLWTRIGSDRLALVAEQNRQGQSICTLRDYEREALFPTEELERIFVRDLGQLWDGVSDYFDLWRDAYHASPIHDEVTEIFRLGLYYADLIKLGPSAAKKPILVTDPGTLLTLMVRHPKGD